MVGVPERSADDFPRAPWWSDASAEAVHGQQQDDDVAVSELIPAEWAGVALRDRLASAGGRLLTIRVSHGVTWTGAVADVGADWFTVRLPDAALALFTSGAVATVSGLPTQVTVASAADPPTQPSLWRQWLRERRQVHLCTTSGTVVEGTVVRVGRDHVDIVEHPRGRVPLMTDDRVTIPLGATSWCVVRD